MNGEGITGFNPELAKRDIEEFKEKVQEAGAILEKAYTELYGVLLYYWASPKAVEFNRFIDSFRDMMYEYGVNASAIVRGAVRAYNYAASANNCAKIGVSAEFQHYSDSYDVKLKDSINGKVGMNINAVKDIVLPEFERQTASAVSNLNNLPTGIALYDNENGQKVAYQTGITNFIEKIVDMNTQVSDAIKSALMEEADNILLAKQNAVDVMNVQA